MPSLVVPTSALAAPPGTSTVSEYTAAPVQVAFVNSSNSTLPPAARFPDVADTVAVSFGNQLCLVLMSVGICWTVTFSAAGWLAHAVAAMPSVFGESPLYDATNTYSPGAVGVN